MLKYGYMQDEGKRLQKTKVCFVITKGVWGGAQKYVYTLATSLPQDQFETLVVMGEGGVLKNRLVEKNIRVYVIENLKRDISLVSEFKSFLALFKIILKEKPHVLHLNSPKAAGYGSFIGRILFVKKIILTVHGFTFNENRPEWKKALIFIFSWITVLFSKKTIVISPQEESQAKAMLFVNDTKIKMIRNGVEKIEFKDKSEARKNLQALVNKDVTGLWIGTIAELHKNKGLEFAINALAKVGCPFSYFIIGEGEQRGELEKTITKLNLQDKVFLPGFLHEAKEHLKAFDLFVLPSVKEGLPFSILEAGRAGLSVVASSVGGIPDIIENGRTGILTTPGRVGEIQRAIEYLNDNPEERKEFGKKLKAKIDKHFSVEQMLKETFELYK
jgi:glycosyltransferase involved in cell wall biosynthesis